MTKTILAAGALVVVLLTVAWAQEHRDDKYKDDPHAFCRKGPNDPSAPSEHSCNCSLMCSDGTETVPPQQMENTACEMYCTKARCLCHPDNPCDKPPIG
jgi:hypothetical protein